MVAPGRRSHLWLDLVAESVDTLDHLFRADAGVVGAEDEVDVLAQRLAVLVEFRTDLRGRAEDGLLSEFLAFPRGYPRRACGLPRPTERMTHTSRHRDVRHGALPVGRSLRASPARPWLASVSPRCPASISSNRPCVTAAVASASSRTYRTSSPWNRTTGVPAVDRARTHTDTRRAVRDLSAHPLPIPSTRCPRW